MLLSITEFIGHFHPVLVHLPIGILLLAGLFIFLQRKEKFASIQPAIRIALFWGMLSAIASCASGFLLSKSDDYDSQLVTKHQWFGIAVAVVSITAYIFFKKKNPLLKWAIGILILLIIITGHFGGSLTHGSDYLTKAFSSSGTDTDDPERKPIPDVQQAVVYTDIIKPIFETRCYTCHSARKKKGGLRLDKPEFILEGGKDGEIIKPGIAKESEMIRRLLLPRNDEDHMPPKEKKQLKESEIELIHWWIETGAPFDKKTGELEQPEKLKPVLYALQTAEKKSPPDIPVTPVEKGDETVIERLKQRGAVVLPVAQNSNYLTVNFVTVDTVTNEDIELLIPLKKQLTWLNLGGKDISDEGLTFISQLTNLTRLQLGNTSITDQGLSLLKSLVNLQYLNLVGTHVTSGGVLLLKDLPKLESIYLYKTRIAAFEWQALKNSFPKTVLDSGGYIVPTLESDTTLVKPPKPIQ